MTLGCRRDHMHMRLQARLDACTRPLPKLRWPTTTPRSTSCTAPDTISEALAWSRVRLGVRSGVASGVGVGVGVGVGLRLGLGLGLGLGVGVGVGVGVGLATPNPYPKPTPNQILSLSEARTVLPLMSSTRRTSGGSSGAVTLR